MNLKDFMKLLHKCAFENYGCQNKRAIYPTVAPAPAKTMLVPADRPAIPGTRLHIYLCIFLK